MSDTKILNELDDFLFKNSQYTPVNYQKILCFVVILILIACVGFFIFMKRRKDVAKKNEQSN